MSLKETILSMMLEALELGEAVEVRHDRYVRSHGKKARDSGGGSSSWMFTHKPMGDVDVKNKEEVHTAQGKFADAKKSAQQWGKQHGHSSVYVLESVELDEETMPGNIALRMVDSHKNAAAYHKKNGNMKGYAAHLDVSDRIEDAVKRAGRDRPIRSTQIEKASDKAFSNHPHRVVRSEEVELDEISKKTLGSYIKKAASDIGYAATADDTNKELKRHKGISKAANKLTKEEVEINEAEIPTYHYYATKNGIGAKEMKLTHAKSKPFTSETDALKHIVKTGGRQDGIIHKVNSATGKIVQHRGIDGGQKAYPTPASDMASDAPKHVRDLKEDLNLGEAKTDIYHKHMLKALGKTRLPKDHNYTSAIANNGDFVVHNAGRVVGRIPKGEHDLK